MGNGFNGPMAVDFYNQLSGLGDTLQANAVLKQKQQLQAARQAALAPGPDGTVDFAKAITAIAPTDLDAAYKISNIQKNISPENTPDIQNYNFAVKNGYKGTPLEYAQAKAAAGATRVTTNNNVSTGGGSDKQIFDSVDESYKAAKAAATGLTGIREARNALQGGIISGAGANQMLGLQKIGAAIGVTDPAAIQNTETFRAAIAPQVAAMLKSTVGTTNISNSDREFAEKAAGGNITLDAGSIARLLNIMERSGTAVVNNHNARLDAIYPNEPKFKRERALFRVDPLSPSDPTNQTQSLGNVQPRQAPDGKFYVPDPNRPGKYLQVVQ